MFIISIAIIEPKLSWTQKELLDFLRDKAGELNENIDQYDGLIVSISGHGWKDHVCTSDYKMIQKTAIHRIFSQPYPAIREIPRIFLYDCCDGDNEQGKGRLKKTDVSMPRDFAKCFTIDDIAQKADDLIWDHGTRNPDYRLVEINAANEGFQAKLNSDIGSYMIHGFVKEMIDDLNEKSKEQKFLYEIFDKVQQELEANGKQQTKSTYNNGTRCIKLMANKHKSSMIDSMFGGGDRGVELMEEPNESKLKLLNE